MLLIIRGIVGICGLERLASACYLAGIDDSRTRAITKSALHKPSSSVHIPSIHPRVLHFKMGRDLKSIDVGYALSWGKVLKCRSLIRKDVVLV